MLHLSHRISICACLGFILCRLEHAEKVLRYSIIVIFFKNNKVMR